MVVDGMKVATEKSKNSRMVVEAINVYQSKLK